MFRDDAERERLRSADELVFTAVRTLAPVVDSLPEDVRFLLASRGQVRPLSERGFRPASLSERWLDCSAMAQTESRLRRLIADELGECCDDDVDRRLAELRSLAETAFADDPAASVFSVLGDDTRYRLARVLAVADSELCVCELDPLVDVSESAVSHALADLVDAGLATRRKAGNWRYYASTTLADELFATADREVGA